MQESLTMSSYLNLIPERRIYQGFIVSITLVVALCISAVFFGIGIRSWNLIHAGMLGIAKAHLDEIVTTRQWNADYGGVYVEKREWVESNPYLKNPDIQATDGRILTKRNPAVMTREISRYFENGGQFAFHITSLKPLNPNNVPDSFERNALTLFERGEKEIYQIESGTFRYMAPLHIAQACLECHAEQGYKLNDIRGGISISFDITEFQNTIRSNFVVIILAAFLTTSILLGFIFFLISKLRHGLQEIRSEIERLAITDGLTGVFNRRQLMSRFEEEFDRARRDAKTLGCIMLDIDHFKAVNDAFGHPIGDMVLKELSTLVKESIRTYDVFGRFGGEEFLVILPACDPEEIRMLAERLRETVKQNLKVSTDPLTERKVTISLGATCVQDADESIDDVLKRADKALYMAKNRGRDRAEWMSGA
jgi:diguanylate cyclase (GGDEF)-like protein